jgi:hypothetical protein
VRFYFFSNNIAVAQRLNVMLSEVEASILNGSVAKGVG